MNEETSENIESLFATERRMAILAKEIAGRIIPNNNNLVNAFFFDAARQIIKGLITAFMLTGPNWTIKDIIQTARSKDKLKFTLLKTEGTKYLIETYFVDEKLFDGIFTVIQSELKEY